jgi:hypothetical protein
MENTTDFQTAGAAPDGDHDARFDAGDRRHVARREKKSKARRRRSAEALCWVMADPRGRSVVWKLLGKAGLFRSSMAPSAELTAFNEGRRDLGLGLLARVMRHCPEQYVRMQAEAISAATDFQRSEQ